MLYLHTHGPAAVCCCSGQGAGARRLAKFRCKAAVQLLLVQGCTEVYSKQYGFMPFVALYNILEVRRRGGHRHRRMRARAHTHIHTHQQRIKHSGC